MENVIKITNNINKKSNHKISVIIPVYLSQDNIQELVKRVKAEIMVISDNFDIVLIDDGSPDDSWEKIVIEADGDKRVKGIKLSRNFGQHHAIYAGLKSIDADYYIIMDCDLQHNPKFFKTLYHEVKKGNDIVYCRVKKRKHNILKNFASWLFYKVYNAINKDILFSRDSFLINYTMISKRAANQYLKVGDFKRFHLQILRYIGFNSSVIDIDHYNRYKGKSSYTFLKLLNYSIDEFIYNSDTFLKIFIYMGFITSSVCSIFIIYTLYKYLVMDLVPGWTSIILTISFSTGVILTCIGVTGLYVGKIFEQVKNRPTFIIADRKNCEE